MAGTTVDVLECERCGVPLPLTDGDAVRCLHCGADRELPEAHRAHRDANRRRGAAEAEATAAFAALGRPPPWYARMWTVVPWTVVLAFGSILAIAGAVRLYFAVLGSAPDPWRLVVSIGLPAAVLVLVLVLGSWGEQRATALGGIQAALAAKPSAQPGGPASCRRCGAPLDAPAGARGARCLYCAADNLTRVPAAWVVRMKRYASKLDDSIEAAWARDRSERRFTAVRALVRGGLLVVPLVGFTVWAYRLHPPDWLPRWQDARAERVVYRYDGRDGERPVMTKLPARLCDPSWHRRPFEPWECDAAGCGKHYYVPLAGGSSARASVEAPGARLVARARGSNDRRELPIHDGQADVRAPTDGWYEVVLDVPHAAAGDRFALCFALRP